MKRIFLLALLATALWALSTSVLAQSQDGLRQYVEPRIGTAHCRYFHFAPGALPFGMAKPGPSTNGHYGNVDGWQATGYDYRDRSIESFPCTHELRWAASASWPPRGASSPCPETPRRRAYKRATAPTSATTTR